MLKIENLCLKNILFDINFSIKSGEIIGIFGSSGSGKSTLLKCIKGFIQTWTGNILYNNKSIDKYNTDIGYIFQETIFFPHISIMENLLLTKQKKDYIIHLLNKFNLSYLINKNVNNLSGGEKQRLGICRSLLLNSKILLMDEPTSALDRENRQIIYNLLINLQKEQNITIIMVSHDEASKYIFNKIYYMSNGIIKLEN